MADKITFEKDTSPEGNGSFARKINFMTTGNADFKLPQMLEAHNGRFITYGDDNQYPGWLVDIYLNSPLNNQIINKKIDYIMGQEIVDESNDPAFAKFLKECNRKGESLGDIVRKCVKDHEIFGGLSFQVVYTKGSTQEEPEIAEIYYTDLAKLRYDVDEYRIKYARTWNMWNRVKTIIFNPYDTLVPTGTTMYYYNGIHTRDLYPIPSYIGGAISIATDVEIGNFYLSQTQNGLFPSILVNMPMGEPTEEEKNDLERRMNKKWRGSTNAGKAMFIFTDPRNTDKSPTITTIEANNLDKRFIEMNKSIENKIFRAHGFNPILLGEQVPGKLGISNEINDARQVFLQDYVEPAQKRILHQFEKVLKVNFPNIKLAIKQLKPLNSILVDEKNFLPFLTMDEARSNLMRAGYVDSIKPTDELIPVERLAGLRNPVAVAPGYTAVSEADKIGLGDDAVTEDTTPLDEENNITE